MGDQIREQIDVEIIQQHQTVDEKLKLINKHVVQVLLASEIELWQVQRCFTESSIF